MCDAYTKATFELYEIDSNNKPQSTGKTFEVTLEESGALLDELAPGYKPIPYECIVPNAILLTMFKKIYGFTLFSGFHMSWRNPNSNDHFNGTNEEALQSKAEGVIAWRGDTWRIKQVL